MYSGISEYVLVKFINDLQYVTLLLKKRGLLFAHEEP